MKVRSSDDWIFVQQTVLRESLQPQGEAPQSVCVDGTTVGVSDLTKRAMDSGSGSSVQEENCDHELRDCRDDNALIASLSISISNFRLYFSR